MSAAKKNVIVLGDSVSIGYTRPLAQQLADIALVQHSPYDVSDGGAEETAYGLQCLDYFVRGPDGRLLQPDVLVFNWGLHNGVAGNSTVPGQNGNATVYLSELEEIVQRLQRTYASTKTKLLFALTSPFLCEARVDSFISARNKVVAGMMSRYGIPTVDPHAAIVSKCGPAPQASCFNLERCWCPHCPPGYAWLAKSLYEPALRAILKSETPIFA